MLSSGENKFYSYIIALIYTIILYNNVVRFKFVFYIEFVKVFRIDIVLLGGFIIVLLLFTYKYIKKTTIFDCLIEALCIVISVGSILYLGVTI